MQRINPRKQSKQCRNGNHFHLTNVVLTKTHNTKTNPEKSTFVHFTFILGYGNDGEKPHQPIGECCEQLELAQHNTHRATEPKSNLIGRLDNSTYSACIIVESPSFGILEGDQVQCMHVCWPGVWYTYGRNCGGIYRGGGEIQSDHDFTTILFNIAHSPAARSTRNIAPYGL